MNSRSLSLVVFLLLLAVPVRAIEDGPEEIAQGTHKFQFFATQKANAQIKARTGRFHRILETVYEREGTGNWVCSITYRPQILDQSDEVSAEHTFRFLAHSRAVGLIRKEHKKLYREVTTSYIKNDAGKWVCTIKFDY